MSLLVLIWLMRRQVARQHRHPDFLKPDLDYGLAHQTVETVRASVEKELPR